MPDRWTKLDILYKANRRNYRYAHCLSSALLLVASEQPTFLFHHNLFSCVYALT
jgi:hypothetical protein